MCAEEWESEGSRGGGLSGWRKVKSSSRLVVSLGSLWNTEPVITDKLNCTSLPHSGLCAPLSLMAIAPLVSLLTAT